MSQSSPQSNSIKINVTASSISNPEEAGSSVFFQGFFIQFALLQNFGLQKENIPKYTLMVFNAIQ